MTRFSSFMEKYFVFGVILCSLVAYYEPSVFIWALPYVRFLIALAMFAMGLTLDLASVRSTAKNPLPVLIGIGAQYLIMPLLALLIARLLGLPEELTVGLILLGSCPGGVASNVMVYLAKGDLALSVAMTAISTMLAPIMIPSLMKVLAGQFVDVDFVPLFISTALIVLAPVLLGILVKIFLPKLTETTKPAIPAFAIVGVLMVVGALVSANSGGVESFDSLLALLLAIILHNICGLSLGFFVALALGLSKEQRRAIAIEVGMQNSGLGAVLAASHFGPMAALPSIIFSAWHNVSASLLTSFWSQAEES